MHSDLIELKRGEGLYGSFRRDRNEPRRLDRAMRRGYEPRSRPAFRFCGTVIYVEKGIPRRQDLSE